MSRIEHKLSIRESPSLFEDVSVSFTEVASVSIYEQPCVLCLRGNLEVLLREFPFAKEMFDFCQDKQVYFKSDELLVTEAGLALWKTFRERFLRDLKLVYLPSQLSELVRYSPDFEIRDNHIDYGDCVLEKFDAFFKCKPDPAWDATFFLGTCQEESCEKVERAGEGRLYQRSLISQRRRETAPICFHGAAAALQFSI